MKTISTLALAAAVLLLSLSCAGAPKVSAAAPVSGPAAEAPVIAAPAAAVTASPPVAAAAAQTGPSAAAADATSAATEEGEYAEAAAAPDDALAAYSSASPAGLEAIKKAQGLAAEGKWRSAYAALEAYDPENADPFALAMRIRLCLDGNIRSDRHIAFALKDLAEGESVDSLRYGEGEYPLFELDPTTLVQTMKEKGIAQPAILGKTLGDYYFDVQANFGGEWFLADEEVFVYSLESYRLAYEAGLYDLESLQRQADILMRFDQAAEATPLLQKALVLDPENPRIHFNLGVSLAMSDMKLESIAEFDKAYSLYTEASDRFDTLALAARVAAQTGDMVLTETYLARADAEYPGQPSPGLLRHYVAIETLDAEKAQAQADAVMDEFASNPTVVRSILSAWVNVGELPAAVAFLERNIARYTEDGVLGTLLFYRAVLYVQSDQPGQEERDQALAGLDAAEAHLRKAYAETEQIFEVISSLRAQLLAPPEEPPAEPEAEAEPPAAPEPPKP